MLQILCNMSTTSVAHKPLVCFWPIVESMHENYIKIFLQILCNMSTSVAHKPLVCFWPIVESMHETMFKRFCNCYYDKYHIAK
jgi:hypothetical protein